MKRKHDRNPVFGKRLRYLRELYRLSQNELATALGVESEYGPNVIGSWERQTREPSFNTLVKIAEFFGVSTDYLLGVTSDVEPKDAILIKTQNLNDDERQLILNIIDAVKKS
jgi:transcriptional regulator with XRE-family HTH domain